MRHSRGGGVAPLFYASGRAPDAAVKTPGAPNECGLVHVGTARLEREASALREALNRGMWGANPG